MSNNAQNVSVAKPAVQGAVFRAPAGTKLPTSATEKLDGAFKCMGYISDEGFKENLERSSEEIKAWGGDVVLNPQTDYKETYGMQFIEALNLEVLKAAYGDDNVDGDLTAGLTIKGNSKELKESVWVVDTVLTGNVLSRLVIPHGKITEIGEVPNKDGEPIGYDATISATPDSDGNCHYKYMVKQTA